MGTGLKEGLGGFEDARLPPPPHSSGTAPTRKAVVREARPADADAVQKERPSREPTSMVRCVDEHGNEVVYRGAGGEAPQAAAPPREAWHSGGQWAAGIWAKEMIEREAERERQARGIQSIGDAWEAVLRWTGESQ